MDIAANYRLDANTFFWVDHSEAAERKYVVFLGSNIPPAKDPARQPAENLGFTYFPESVGPGAPADMTHNVDRCRNSAIPHQELRSRFDSVCVGYSSDELFHFIWKSCSARICQNLRMCIVHSIVRGTWISWYVTVENSVLFIDFSEYRC